MLRGRRGYRPTGVEEEEEEHGEEDNAHEDEGAPLLLLALGDELVSTLRGTEGLAERYGSPATVAVTMAGNRFFLAGHVYSLRFG
jgi:hypothetical protein